MAREIIFKTVTEKIGNGYLMGEKIPSTDFYVGDIVLCKPKKNSEPDISFIAGTDKHPFIMGWGGKQLSEFHSIKKLIKHEHVTNEVFTDLFPSFFIQEKVVLTIEELISKIEGSLNVGERFEIGWDELDVIQKVHEENIDLLFGV